MTSKNSHFNNTSTNAFFDTWRNTSAKRKCLIKYQGNNLTLQMVLRKLIQVLHTEEPCNMVNVLALKTQIIDCIM